MILSTTTRRIGQHNEIEDFFAFLDLLKKTEFKAVNLGFSELAESLQGAFDANAFAKRFRAYGFTANCAHAPMFYPFLFHLTDGKDWEKAIMNAIAAAAACGVRDFVMHLGSVVDGEMHYLPKLSLEKNLVYLRPYLERAAALGMGIAIENGTNQPWDVEYPLKDVSPGIDELIAIVDAVNAEYGKEICGVCFDFGHANVAQLDIAAELEKIGRRLKVVHIHDNDGSFDQHRLPFEGSVDWRAGLAALTKIGYDGELSLELYYEDGELTNDPVAYLNHTYHVLKKLLY